MRIFRYYIYFLNVQEFLSEILTSCSSLENDEAMKLISDDKDKFSSIDIEDLKVAECHQKFPLTIVDSIHGRFQDSVKIIIQKGKRFLEFSQGNISLCLFDSIVED
jgi:hypothetical protein